MGNLCWMSTRLENGARVRLGAWVSLASWLLAVAFGSAAGPRFYSDDPIAREPETQDASGAQPEELGFVPRS